MNMWHVFICPRKRSRRTLLRYLFNGFIRFINRYEIVLPSENLNKPGRKDFGTLADEVDLTAM
jgi:hypothetical protein